MTQAAAQPTIQRAKAGTAVVNYEEELAAEALAIAKRIGAPSGDLIRCMKDKTFQLPSGQASALLDCVVVGFVTMNQYYEGKYDPKNIQPPVCMAVGQVISEMRPFDKVPKKQSDDGCTPCAMNQWGTDGKGKACKNQRLLALVAPDAQADGPIMLLKISPTGTRFWDNYVTQATAAMGNLIKVVTQISFDPAVDYASLRFKMLRPNQRDKSDPAIQGFEDAFGRRAAAMDRLLAEPDFAPAVVASKPGDKK